MNYPDIRDPEYQLRYHRITTAYLIDTVLISVTKCAMAVRALRELRSMTNKVVRFAPQYEITGNKLELKDAAEEVLWQYRLLKDDDPLSLKYSGLEEDYNLLLEAEKEGLLFW